MFGTVKFAFVIIPLICFGFNSDFKPPLLALETHTVVYHSLSVSLSRSSISLCLNVGIVYLSIMPLPSLPPSPPGAESVSDGTDGTDEGCRVCRHSLFSFHVAPVDTPPSASP